MPDRIDRSLFVLSTEIQKRKKPYKMGLFSFLSNKCQESDGNHSFSCIPAENKCLPSIGGKGRIRTDGTPKRTLDFESSAFDHSATFPVAWLIRYRNSQAQKYIRRFSKTKHWRAITDQGTSASKPFMYGCSTSGIATLPSAFWKFSRIATKVRPTARPEPFSVCSSSGLP